MNKFIFLSIIVIAVIVILVVVVSAVHIFKSTSVSAPSPFSNLSSGASMFAVSSNLYNTTAPFNQSYNFYFSYPSSNGSSNLSTFNGTFWIAKYNNLFRGSFEYESSLSALPNLSLSISHTASLIYNGSSIILCNKEIIINDSPINSTVAASLVSANSEPALCNISSADGATSFDIAASFTAVPILVVSPTSNYSAFVTSLANATVKFLGIKSYLGENCYSEELTPKINSASSLSFFDCLSAKNGLPISIVYKINNSAALESNLSAINPPPTGQATITNLPPNSTISS